MKNYIQKIRSKLGHDSFIHPAARIIIENDQNEFLAIVKNDNGQLGIPAGALEEGETIEECIKREVWEETGLRVQNIQVIGISSNPDREAVSYSNGDQIQYFTVEFYAYQWEGDLKINDTDEIKAVKFVPFDMANQLPANEQSTFESLAYFKAHQSVMLK